MVLHRYLWNESKFRFDEEPSKYIIVNHLLRKMAVFLRKVRLSEVANSAIIDSNIGILCAECNIFHRFSEMV